jgi:glycine/D-amino acid oxidase-like deaminating enzyme
LKRIFQVASTGDRQVHAARLPYPAGIESNRQHALKLFPFLREHPIKRTWSGWMPFIRELRPMIGRLSGFERLYILTGLGSAGFEQGLMAGKLFADFIHTGTLSPLFKEADPASRVT